MEEQFELFQDTSNVEFLQDLQSVLTKHNRAIHSFSHAFGPTYMLLAHHGDLCAGGVTFENGRIGSNEIDIKIFELGGEGGE